MMLRRRGLLCAVSVLLLGLGACGPVKHEYHYPAPDGRVRLVVKPDGGRLAATGRRNEVFFYGARLPEAAVRAGRPLSDQVYVGAFTGTWPPASIAWLDATTVNICPLNKDDPQRSFDVLPEAEAGGAALRRETYRVTIDCPAAPLSPG